MSILDDVERAEKGAAPLMKLLVDSDPASFEQDLEAYAQADGIMNADFLTNLENLKPLLPKILNMGDLEPAFDFPVEFQMAIIELIIERGKFNLLPLMAAKAKDKQIKKHIKRRVHDLKSKGQKIKETSPKAGFKFKKVTEPHPPSLISESNRLGEREIFYSTLTPGQGIRLLYVLTKFNEGIVDFRTMDTSRSGLRDIVKTLRNDSGLDIFEVPMPVGHYFITQAKKTNEISKKQLPARFLGAFQSMPSPEKPVTDCPTWEIISKDMLVNRFTDFMKSEALHNEKDFRNWTLPLDTLKGMESKFTDIFQNKIILDQGQKEDQADRLVNEIINAYFDEKNRSLWVSRIEEGAYFLANQGKTDMAIIALTVAKALEQPERYAAGIPFCKELLGKLLKQHTENIDKEKTDKENVEKDPKSLILP